MRYLKKSLAVFQLYLSGFKYQEIAEMTQEPLGTVKSRIHLCRKKQKSYWWIIGSVGIK
ncbi:sigma factor-like helix-turn-helix DNA-binding protein [Parabacteroides sp.]